MLENHAYPSQALLHLYLNVKLNWLVIMNLRLLDEILIILSDSSWHDVDEIARKLLLSEKEVKTVSDFLGVFGLVIFDENRHRMKITPFAIESLELPQQTKGRNFLEESH